MTTTEKRRRAALHEAGHAVVAAEHGFQLHAAEVYERGGGACLAEIPPRNSLEALKRELEYVLAGRLTVAIDKGENWRSIDLARVIEREVTPKGGLRDRLGSYELAAARLWGGPHYGAISVGAWRGGRPRPAPRHMTSCGEAR